MLPKGCCRVVYYSTEYVPSYKCNFLGVSPDVSVPVDTALCVLIDVSEVSALDNGAPVVKGRHISEYRQLNDEVMYESGPPSMLLCAADTDELYDLSQFHYSVIHSSRALQGKGLCRCLHRCFSSVVSDGIS